MFIFCKVKDGKIKCLLQSWAFKSPFAKVFVCPIHGFVDADGNRYDEVDIDGERFSL